MDWFNICVMVSGCIIEIFLLFDFFHNYFEIKAEKRYIKLTLIAACLLLFGINALGMVSIHLICLPLLLWIFVSILFESEPGARLGCVAAAYSVIMGTEFLYLIFMKKAAGIASQKGPVLVSDYGGRILFSAFLTLLVFFILKQASKRSHKRMGNKIFLLYLCVPVSELGILVTMFYFGMNFVGSHTAGRIMAVFFILMLIADMTVFYGFQKYTDNIMETARKQLELKHKNAELDQLPEIMERDEDYDETVHNMSHFLKVIEQLAIENKNEEIRDVVEELNGKLFQGKANEYCNHKMLNMILSEYAEKAEKAGIEFSVYVEPGCVLSHIKDIDLISMMGNLLDNAITAAAKGKPSFVTIKAFMHMKGRMCMIKVINNCEGELEVAEGKIMSTKKEKGIHGIGLTSVLRTAEKYEGSFSYYIENREFHAVLILPVK